MKGILNNYIAAHKKRGRRRLRSILALFLLSSVVATSVVWCLRFVGTALSETPVYEAPRQVAVRTSPGYRDDRLPLSPNGKVMPTVGAKGFSNLNLALNIAYTASGANDPTKVSGNYYPDMGQLTDGVYEKDGASALLSLKEGTYVGFNEGISQSPRFDIDLNFSGFAGTHTISEIRVHYRVQLDSSICAPASVKYAIGGHAEGTYTVTDLSDGTHTASFAPDSDKNTGNYVTLTFEYQTGKNWIFISEIEILSADAAGSPKFGVQYYGYVDELVLQQGGAASTASVQSAAPAVKASSLPRPVRPLAAGNSPKVSPKALSNVALGKQYKYNVYPSYGYRDGGAADQWHTGFLTDDQLDHYEPGMRPTGVLNGYCGYYDTIPVTDYEVVVDLGNLFDVTKASIDLYWHDQNTAEPTKLECAYSTNGNDWRGNFDIISSKTERSVLHSYNGKTQDAGRTAKTHICNHSDSNVKYVKFTISTPKRLYIDEINVQGQSAPASNWAPSGQYKGTEGEPYDYGGYHDQNTIPANAAWTDWHSGELNDGTISDSMGTSSSGCSEVGIGKAASSNTLKLAFKLSNMVNVTKVSAYFLPRTDPNKGYPDGIAVSVGSTDNAANATALGSYQFSESSTPKYPSGATYCREFTVANSAGVEGQYVFITITINSTVANSNGVTNTTEIQIWGTASATPPPPPEKYTVTVDGGTATPASAAAGAQVTITAAAPPSGKMFDLWEVVDFNASEPAATFPQQPNNPTTTFTMPAHAVHVRARYRTAGSVVELPTIIDTRYEPNGEPRYGNRSGHQFEPGGNLPMNDSPGVERYSLVSLPLAGTKTSATPMINQKLVKLYRTNWYYEQFYNKVERVNILKNNIDWQFTEIWKLNPNADPASTNASDWTLISGTAAELNAMTIAGDLNLADGAVIRFVYNPKPDTYTHNNTHFFDYDITKGHTDTANGVNDEGMYPTSDNGQGCGINLPYPNNNPGTYLAFGNANTGVPRKNDVWTDKNNVGNTLNKYNSANNRPRAYCHQQNSVIPTTKPINGATFGLVKEHLLTDPTAAVYRYNNGLDFNVRTSDAGWLSQWETTGDVSAVPAMFKLESSENKRRYFNDMNITFAQNGDSYEITSVGKGNETYLSDLNNFRVTAQSFLSDNDIWSNNFWAMDHRHDDGTPALDPLFGNTNHYHYWGECDSPVNHPEHSALPASDDNVAHNSYFGMNFDIEFDLSEDYVGPLTYFFYGDDDLWVYLDGVLVCDIGGVHSSIGEIVNLWDTLSPYSVGRHKLSVFYTERGASGSSCYMRFNLPGVSVQPPAAEVSSLIIQKEGVSNISDDQVFTFKVELFENGSPYFGGSGELTVNKYASYETFYDPTAPRQQLPSEKLYEGHSTVTLRKGQLAIISKLPDGVTYRVTEVGGGSYAKVEALADRLAADATSAANKPTAAAALTDVGSDKVYNSSSETQIVGGAKFSRVHFINTGGYPLLPSTGGMGRELLPVLGLTAVIFSTLAPVVLHRGGSGKNRKQNG